MAELNQWEADTARQSANDNAQAAYNQGMLELGRADLAFKKAQQAWKETMDRAGLTGTFEGMPTQAALQYGAEAFGVWGAPQQGQETLASKQQTYQQAFDTAGQFGQYYGPGAVPAAGTKTAAQLEQEFTQAQRTQQEQRAAQAQQQSQAQQYLSLLAGLRGPADWVKYQQVLGSTPGGMRDLVGAAMGQYVPGGGATTGYQPQAASLQSMMGDVTGQAYYGQSGGQLGMPNVYNQNSAGMYAQQPQYTNQYQYPQASAAQQTQAMLQGQTNPQAYAQQAQREALPWTGGGTNTMGQQEQMLNAQGKGTNTMGATQPQYQSNLPAPNQIAPQSWANMAPSQQQMLLGEYESQGWHKPDVEALFNQSLPKYAANAPTAGTFRLGR